MPVNLFGGGAPYIAEPPFLGQSQQSRVTPVASAGGNPTELIRLPLLACQPAHLCIRNVHASAIVYIKSGPGIVSATDYGIVLNPGEFYDWGGSPPRDAIIRAVSTVDKSLVAIEANWCVTREGGR